MKNLIQKIIFNFTIVYITIFSILTINNLIQIEDKLNTTPNYPIENLKTLKKKIDLLDNNECNQSIKDLYNASNTLMFNKTTKLKSFYETVNNNSIISNYFKVTQKCNLTDELKEELAPKVISAAMVYEELREKYFYQYEITIEDKLYREITETNLTNSKLQSGKYQEIEIIEKLIEVNHEK